MQIEYIGWDVVETIKVNSSSLVSIESNDRVDGAITELIQVYLTDQSRAGQKFVSFQALLADLLSQYNISHQIEDPELNDLVVEVEWIIEDPVHDSSEYLEAQLTTYGKLISARIAFLIVSIDKQIEWLDPRDVLITNEAWTKSEIDLDVSRTKFSKLDSTKSYLTTHGIGSSSDNQNTLTKISSYWGCFFD